MEAMHRGWLRHMEVDKHFHSSDFFREKTELIKGELQNVSYHHKEIRPFVLAHIGLEIMLDALLLRTNKVNADLFYQHLTSISEKSTAHFLKLNGIEQAESFLPMYSRFHTTRYLLSYKDNENLSYALRRICFRIWKVELTEDEQRGIYKAMVDSLLGLEKDYMSIFDEISEKLPGH